jgi:hypothetical protein
MKTGSVDLIVCQEGSESIPYCQVGRDEQMRLSVGLINSEVSWNQPGELTEQVSSKIDLDQHVQLTEEEEDQDDILMIGGIGVFLPCAQEEAEVYVADDATTVEEKSQLTMTIREEEELEQVFETTQAQAEVNEEENEHSEECLNIFSQEDEEAVALKLTVEEGNESEHSEEWLNDFSHEAEEAVALKLTSKGADEEDDEHSEEWLNIFSQEAEKTATGEVAEAEEEEADNICFVDLWEQVEALEERVKVQSVHIQ